MELKKCFSENLTHDKSATTRTLGLRHNYRRGEGGWAVVLLHVGWAEDIEVVHDIASCGKIKRSKDRAQATGKQITCH